MVSASSEFGMKVTVEITTGRRSVISYLLLPLDRPIDDSMYKR